MARNPHFKLERHGPRAGGKPQQLVFMLHGVTKDAHEVHDWAPQMAKILPHAQFISIHAPYVYEGGLGDVPAGTGRQWWSLKDLPEQGGFRLKNLKGYARAWFQIHRISAQLNEVIDRELKSCGLDERQAALFGFSQGAITGNYVSLRRTRPLAATISYAGGYFGLMPVKCQPYIMVLHGTADPTVPFVPHFEKTVKGLSKAGAHVEPVRRLGLAHELTEVNMTAIAERIKMRFDFAKDHNLASEDKRDWADYLAGAKEVFLPDRQPRADRFRALELPKPRR